MEPKSYDHEMKEFVKEIRVAAARMGMNSVKEITEAAGLGYDRIRHKLVNPGTIKLSELLPLMDALNMGPESLEVLVGRKDGGERK